jgi:hypothetical protein
VKICTQASSSQSTMIIAMPARMRGQSAASRSVRQANSTKGKKRKSTATVLQDFSGAAAPGAEMSAGSQ